jgi:BirA family biotin operon repressor/biotin-[acetyl-CoA-carboxylase] ligase
MQLIKLDATASTNLYLKNLMLEENLVDFTIVTAKEQLKGKGQMGASWDAEKGKNLTFSVLKHQQMLLIKDQFILNMLVSLAIYKSLEYMKIPDLSIKWPNDILSGRNKICGILIENLLLGQKISASIIGIGLNVNQTQFKNLPNATSLKLITGKTFDLDEVLQIIAKNLELLFGELGSGHEQLLKKAYLKVLFRKDKASTFKNTASNELFTAIIRTIADDGTLVLELEDQVLKCYNLKEIKLMY